MGYKIKDDDKLIELKKQHQENSRAWHETDDPEEKAGLHRANEMLSKQMDEYTGGKSSYDPKTGKWTTAYNDGNGNWKNSGVHTSAEFTYNQQKKIDDLMADITGSRFNYNPYDDPSYKAYEAMYRREGDRAVKSTLAEVAAAQGGMSSYAGTAAQQAANYYAQQLSDKIPYLEQLAYEKYNANLGNKYNMLSALQNDKANEYNKWNDEVNRRDYLDELAYNREYQKEQDAKEDARFEWQKDYQIGRDAVSDEQWNKNYGLNVDTQNFNQGVTLYQLAEQGEQQKNSDAINDYEIKRSAWNDVVGLIQNGVSIPSFYLNVLGMTLPEVYAAYRGSAPVQNASAKITSGGGGKKTGGKTVKNNSPKVTEPVIDEKSKEIEDKINQIYDEWEKGFLTEEEADRRIAQIQNHGL